MNNITDIYGNRLLGEIACLVNAYEHVYETMSDGKEKEYLLNLIEDRWRLEKMELERHQQQLPAHGANYSSFYPGMQQQQEQHRQQLPAHGANYSSFYPGMQQQQKQHRQQLPAHVASCSSFYPGMQQQQSRVS